MTKCEVKNLVGRRICVTNKVSGSKMTGTIIDVIPANTVPSESAMEAFYGADWKGKKCRTAKCALEFDRVSFIDEHTGSYVVQPLNPKAYDTWSIE